MEDMKAMLASMKRQREQEKEKVLKMSGEPAAKKKYIRRGEIEAALEEEERRLAQEAQAAAKKREEEERQAALAQEKAKEEELKKKSNSEQKQETRKEESIGDSQLHFSESEAIKRLRQLGHPITLFGETSDERARRLEALIHSNEGGEMQLDQAYTDTKEAAEDKEDDYDEEYDGDVAENVETDERKVYRFFKEMLGRWEEALANRPENVKRSAQGKIASRTMKQCKDYIRPLFRLCKSNSVPADILTNLVDIVRFCKAGEFVSANDSYIKLAIGNAAWPIGVTMVGIHERTGREKINSNKRAHVMNNELQRKYITSVKRLITFAQSLADVVPSKKVS